MVLPQSMRLKGHRCFDHLHRDGKRFHGSSMVLRVATAKPHLLKASHRNFKLDSCKCAVSISSKVSKKAVIRNRLRRMIHCHLSKRLFNQSHHVNTWILFSLKPNSSTKEHIPLIQECDLLLRKAGLFL